MNLELPEKFLLGANYWTRNQGPAMWRDWHPDEIDAEFAEMRELGLNTVRCFVTWNDFQPIREYYKGGFSDKVPIKVCLRHDESQTVETNPHLMDFTMVERFDEFLAIAAKHQIRVIPALLVGFMGSVLFDVDFRNGRSIYTDPTMLYYQELYFSFFAKRYCDNDTILAWQFGNEMGCYEKPGIPANLRLWMRILTTAIRQYDQRHPITSGDQAHVADGKSSDNGHWFHHVSVDMCDITTVHSYPVFMPETRGGALSLRSTYSAPWRSRLAAGQYTKPVLTEEISTIGTSYMADETAAKWTRATLFSLLGNGDSGMLWWTNSDMTCHDRMPYCFASTNASEHGGLSLIDIHGNPKLQAEEFRAFSQLMQNVDFSQLKKAPARAAIVHSADSELNSAAKRKISLTAFILAKMAGFEVDIINCEADFDRYQLLICPSYAGLAPIYYKDQRRVDQFVKNGGCLYLSMEDGCWERFEPLFGVRIKDRQRSSRALSLSLTGNTVPTPETIAVRSSWETTLCLNGAEAVAVAEDGSPVVTAVRHGKGTAFFSSVNLEEYLSNLDDTAFDVTELHRFYSLLREAAGIESTVSSTNPLIEVCDCGRYIVLINHGRETFNGELRLDTSVTALTDVTTGETLTACSDRIVLSIPAFDGMILERQG